VRSFVNFIDAALAPPSLWLSREKINMVEPLLSGIVLGMIPVTLSGLFVTAYLQYRRGDQLNF
jgi:cytochrome b6-f complex subunit 5